MVDLRPIGINIDTLNKYNYDRLMSSVSDIDGTPYISNCPKITGDTECKFLYSDKHEDVVITYKHKVHIAKGSYGVVHNATMKKGAELKDVVIKLVKYKNAEQITDVIKEVIMQYIISSVIVFENSVCPKVYRIFINDEDDMIIGIVMDKVNSSFNDKLAELYNFPAHIQLLFICTYLLRFSVIMDKLFELYNFNHRDMKPNNIMCGKDPLDIKIIDFGMSCMTYNGIKIFTDNYYRTQNSKQGRDLYQLLSYLTHDKENPSMELLSKITKFQLKPLMDMIKINGINLKHVSPTMIETKIDPHLKHNRLVFEDAKNLEFSFKRGIIENLNFEKFSTPRKTTLLIPSPTNWGFDKDFSIYLFLENLDYEINVREINNNLLLILNEMAKSNNFVHYYGDIKNKITTEISTYTGKTFIISDSNSLKYHSMISYQILTDELLKRAFTSPYVFSIYRLNRVTHSLEKLDIAKSHEPIDRKKYKYFAYEFFLSNEIIHREYPLVSTVTGGTLLKKSVEQDTLPSKPVEQGTLPNITNNKKYEWYIGLFGGSYYIK